MTQVSLLNRSTRNSMTEKVKLPTPKPRPPTLGLSTAAGLWLLGSVILYAPSYLGITSGWQILFIVVGLLVLVVSFAGAVTELGKLWNSQGLTYWGASLVFFLPAFLLHLAVTYQSISGAFAIVAKVGVLVFIVVGGGLFFQGMPFFFWKQDSSQKPKVVQPADSPDAQSEKAAKFKTNLEIIASIIVALLSVATATVTLIEKILQ